MKPNKLFEGASALPVTEDTWRLRDTGYIIDQKTKQPLQVRITAITRHNGEARLTLRLTEPAAVSVIPDELLTDVSPAALFKTREAALDAAPTQAKKPFDVTFTMIGTLTLRGTDKAVVERLAGLTPVDDIHWDRGTLAVTDVQPLDNVTGGDE